jgi:hypothetical protein
MKDPELPVVNALAQYTIASPEDVSSARMTGF